MGKLYSYVFGKPKDPDPATQIGSKRNGVKDPVTYAFLLTIVCNSTSDYNEKDDIETVALYNESCNLNYISARFAREKLHILDPSSKDECDKTLVWVCRGLGRYEQRTVFLIAPNADFDLLFGYEEDFNVMPDQDDQFQRGIAKNVLSKNPPRVSFKTGVDAGFMLPLQQSASTSESLGRHRIPTLAEINEQLAQLDSSQTRKQAHRLKRDFNTLSPHSSVSPPIVTLVSTRDEDFESAAIMTPQQCERRDALALVPVETVIVKGSKRCHPEQENSPSTTEECPRSPKIRHVRTRPMSAILTKVDTPPSSENAELPRISRDPSPAATKSQSSLPTQEDPHITDPEAQSLQLVGRDQPGTEILFSGMERCTTSSSLEVHQPVDCHDSDSIDLPSARSSRDLERKCSSSAQVGCTVKGVKSKPSGKKKDRRKRKSKKYDAIDEEFYTFSTSGDWTEKIFNDYWTMDPKVGNYYHVDKVTNNKIWYKAP